MILKNFKTITPVRRFFFFFTPYIYNKLKYKQLYNKILTTNTRKNTKKHFKSTHITSIKSYPHIIYTYLNFKMFKSVLINFLLHPNKQKLFSEFKDIYNFKFITQSTNNQFVGFKFFPQQLKINQPFFIADIPYYSKISLISLTFFKKVIYCRSSGTSAIKSLFTKKNKLSLITLPSTKQKFIPNTSVCILGTIFDLKTNICWKGKFKNQTHKKISVRGVAMNPIDHPNGGRTKAKQPEKSPWGWIAKHNK